MIRIHSFHFDCSVASLVVLVVITHVMYFISLNMDMDMLLFFESFCLMGVSTSCFHLSLGTGKETEETTMVQHLSDACLVVDALEPSVREELVNNFCSRELTSYEQIFEAAGAFNYC